MSYTNDLTQIRAGLVNYIGSMLKATKYEGKAANQIVSSILSEEVLKLSQDKDGVIDLYIVKPMIKGVIFVFKQRIVELSKLPKDEMINKQKKVYEDIIKTLEDIISLV